MDEARQVITTVADATGSVRSSLDALEQLLAVLHDDNYISVAEAREVHELSQRLAWDAQRAAKVASIVSYHALMQSEEVV